MRMIILILKHILEKLNICLTEIHRLSLRLSLILRLLTPFSRARGLSHHGDEDLHTISEKESDEFIKSSVKDLIPIPSESKDTFDSDKECDLPFSVTFSNHLFDFNDDFTSSDDESFPNEDVQEENFKIYSNPIFEFDDEYISSDVNPLFNEVLEDIDSEDSYVSNFDESVLPVTHLFDANEDECFGLGGDIDEINVFLDMDVSTDIKEDYYDSEGDIIYLESLLFDDIILNLPHEVFLDQDPRSLKDDPDNDGLKSMIKVFDFGSEDLIFDPDIFAFSFYSLEPTVSHRSGTFMCFNVYLYILNESPMEIRSSTCFVPNITMI
ncbi:hypothetical protein Tco_0151916 [Tanacetum coccineum]